MTIKNIDQRSVAKKRLTVEQCALTQGQMRKCKPIPWTERPTGAFMGGGWFTHSAPEL